MNIQFLKGLPMFGMMLLVSTIAMMNGFLWPGVGMMLITIFMAAIDIWAARRKQRRAEILRQENDQCWVERQLQRIRDEDEHTRHAAENFEEFHYIDLDRGLRFVGTESKRCFMGYVQSATENRRMLTQDFVCRTYQGDWFALRYTTVAGKPKERCFLWLPQVDIHKLESGDATYWQALLHKYELVDVSWTFRNELDDQALREWSAVTRQRRWP